jgi:hypothetical protein
LQIEGRGLGSLHEHQRDLLGAPRVVVAAATNESDDNHRSQTRETSHNSLIDSEPT